MTDPILHNGRQYFTGLQMPEPNVASPVPDLEAAAGLMLTVAEIEAVARDGSADKRRYFGKEVVSDQRNSNACNGHAMAGALSQARTRRGLPFVRLSGAYPYSKINGNQDQGSQLRDSLMAVERYGSPPETLVPWDQIYARLQPANADAEAARYKGFEAYAVRTQQGLWSALALGFDVVVAVHVGNRFSDLNQRGIAGVDSGPGNHAVRCDGLYWDNGLTGCGVNSWGMWGDQGRMGLTWDHFRECFNVHLFYALRSTGDDPKGASPPTAS